MALYELAILKNKEIIEIVISSIIRKIFGSIVFSNKLKYLC